MIDWNSLVARDGPTVWKVLWKLLGNSSDVEECFQETFLEAVKISQRESVESWPALLVRIATTEAIDRLRTRYRSRRRAEVYGNANLRAGRAMNSTANPDNPVELAIATELSERLREALAELPEKQAEIFILHALNGWSYRDLGERMQMNENAIRTALHRARQRLRELLDA
jgi:RNA polymerase sigma-70 factor, ECF subfamily